MPAQEASILIRSELLDDGVMLATIDMPGRSMNVFSSALMDALEALIEDVEATPDVRSVVLASGKSSFLAGADLAMVRGFAEPGPNDTETAMFQRCGRLGRLFLRVEHCAKPWVAAVNGTALGGGLELAMACRARLAADDPRALIGLPEVRWGLLPGAGGTQRLPRFLGCREGLDMLLTGRSITPREAAERGLFARVVAPAELLADACALARSLHGTLHDEAAKFPHHAQSDVPPNAPGLAREIAADHGVSGEDFDRYPAYGAIIDSVLLGAHQPLDAATDIEMRQFLRLMFDPVAGNMVRTLFLNRQRADKELAAPAGLKIASLSHGPLDSNAIWQDALARSRLNPTQDNNLPACAAQFVDSRGETHRVTLLSLDAPAVAAGATALLSAAGPYGRVLEIVDASEPAAQALAALAVRLGALPWRTPGPRSALRALAATRGADLLDAQALAALHLYAEGQVHDAELFDVAACTAGITPPYSGGPFTHLWRQRQRLTGDLQEPAATAWQRLSVVLARSFPT